MPSDATKVVYTFFATNYLYFTWLRGNRSEMVGKRSRGLFLKGPRGLLGVSGGPNYFLIKLSSVAHHFTVFFGEKDRF